MRILYATLFIVIADQATKLLVRGVRIPILGLDIAGMPLYSSREIMGNLIRLTYVENGGTAFGLGPGFIEIFAVFSLLASVAIFIYLYLIRDQGRGVRFSFALILGGAVGNMIDRVFSGPVFDGTQLFKGKVVDFIEVNFFHFPFVFNIADAAVTVGVLMLIFFQRKVVMQSQQLEMAGDAEAGIDGEGGTTADEKNRTNGAI